MADGGGDDGTTTTTIRLHGGTKRERVTVRAWPAQGDSQGHETTRRERRETYRGDVEVERWRLGDGKADGGGNGRSSRAADEEGKEEKERELSRGREG